MSNSITAASTQAASSGRPLLKWVKHHSTPYHLTVAVVLGLVTAGFGALVVVLIIIATNFNVLGWIE